MAYTIDEGMNINVADALAGQYYTYQGTKLNFSLRAGTTNCYIASAAYNDGTGRFRDVWFDHLNSNSLFETAHVTTR